MSILSSSPLQVDEGGGFVEICVEADHESQTPYEVVLIITNITANGKYFYMHMFCLVTFSSIAGEDYVSDICSWISNTSMCVYSYIG